MHQARPKQAVQTYAAESGLDDRLAAAPNIPTNIS